MGQDEQPEAPESNQSSDALIGKVLDSRYQIIRSIGQGAMGHVYEGLHIAIHRRVAIKCLHGWALGPTQIERFRREAQAASRAKHPHIIDVTDFGQLPDGSPFMVLEYLEGRDLDDLIERDGPLSLERAASIVCQLCDALAAAHHRGIVHRDLKPSNVFVIANGENLDYVKVLDFGISKLDDAGSDKKLTQTGAILGTPLFMSPEQVETPGDVDHRSDLFSLGGILYFALTKQPPFDGHGLHALLIAVSKAEPAPLLTLRPDLPEVMATVVSKALAKEPADRFQTAADFKAALVPYRTMSTLPPPMHSDTPHSSPAPSVGPSARPFEPPLPPTVPRGIGWPAVALVAILALTAALGLVLWNAQSAREAPAASAAPPNAVAEPAPLPATVQLALRTQPIDAELRIDGQRTDNPFRAELPRSNRILRIEASLAAHEPELREVRLDQPADVVLVLSPSVSHPAQQRRKAKRDGAKPLDRASSAPPMLANHEERAELVPEAQVEPPEAEPAGDLAPEPAAPVLPSLELKRIGRER